jgi:hypothetical protein
MQGFTPPFWQLAAHEKSLAHDFVLNEFDMTYSAHARLVPLRRDESWETIDAFAPRSKAASIVGVLPPLLQMHTRLHSALRTMSVPYISLPVQQRSALPQVCAQFAVSGVVALCEDMLRIESELEKIQSQHPLHVHAVLGPRDILPQTKPTTYSVSYEMHLVPSMVILLQCPHLSAKNADGSLFFHPTNRCTWELKEEGVYLSDPESRFVRTLVPRPMKDMQAPCACGNTATLSFI